MDHDAELLEALEDVLDELTTEFFANAPCDDMAEAGKFVDKHPVVIMAKAITAKAKGGAEGK